MLHIQGLEVKRRNFDENLYILIKFFWIFTHSCILKLLKIVGVKLDFYYKKQKVLKNKLRNKLLY